MIDSYSFGRMIIDGRIFTSDLILFPERINDRWWRKSGHKLCLEDIREVIKEKPEVIIVGTGFSGLMKVEEAVMTLTKSKGIILIIENTEKAVQSYNSFSRERRTVGAFHLTC